VLSVDNAMPSSPAARARVSHRQATTKYASVRSSIMNVHLLAAEYREQIEHRHPHFDFSYVRIHAFCACALPSATIGSNAAQVSRDGRCAG
jgi:hypothetical protein